MRHFLCIRRRNGGSDAARRGAYRCARRKAVAAPGLRLYQRRRKNPGVYSYKQRLTVGEVVKDAGGFASYADADGLNLAAMTEDGMHIHVPYKLDGMPVEKEDDGKIHINEADEKKLTELPGIGPAMAAQIVAYRDEHGAFTSVEELKQVKGIGTAKWEKLKDKVDL